jgi:copper chaperone NosL
MRKVKTIKRVAVLLIIFSIFPLVSFSGEKQPVKPSPKDKCPVCGMFVAKYPDFLTEVLFKDGSYALFDGAKDLFKYYFQLEKYQPSRKRSDIDSIFMTDYYSLTLTDGFQAYYVIGGDIYGPMGRELIPFGKEADAREFLKDHKGKMLLRFQEITLDRVRGLD